MDILLGSGKQSLSIITPQQQSYLQAKVSIMYLEPQSVGQRYILYCSIIRKGGGGEKNPVPLKYFGEENLDQRNFPYSDLF